MNNLSLPQKFKISWDFVKDIALIAIIINFIKQLFPALYPSLFDWLKKSLDISDLVIQVFIVLVTLIIVIVVIVGVMYRALQKLHNEGSLLPDWVMYILIGLASLVTTYQFMKFDKIIQNEKVLEKGFACPIQNIKVHENEKIIVKIAYTNVSNLLETTDAKCDLEIKRIPEIESSDK